jgi:NADH pyrophosphatase NudC (nudix superfamily)
LSYQRQLIKHCRACGSAVLYRLPDDGDTKLRAICTECHLVHYENPLNVVGTVPHFGERVLLCKRNIEPRKGKWTLPAGFMELGESTSEGAARETFEEAGAHFKMGSLFTVMRMSSSILVLKLKRPECFLKQKFLGTTWPLELCKKL